MSKKIIGSVMTGALALSLITTAVPAAPVDAAGKVTYKVKGTTLTISGKGEMPKSMVFGKKSKTKNIKKVVIKKGVTTISKNAFKKCTIAIDIEKDFRVCLLQYSAYKCHNSKQR